MAPSSALRVTLEPDRRPSAARREAREPLEASRREPVEVSLIEAREVSRREPGETSRPALDRRGEKLQGIVSET